MEGLATPRLLVYLAVIASPAHAQTAIITQVIDSGVLIRFRSADFARSDACPFHERESPDHILCLPADVPESCGARRTPRAGHRHSRTGSRAQHTGGPRCPAWRVHRARRGVRNEYVGEWPVRTAMRKSSPPGSRGGDRWRALGSCHRFDEAGLDARSMKPA